MTTSIKGPALFLAQFLGDEAPFNSLPSIVEWAAGLGYKGVQIPTWDARVFDLDKAATSKVYCDEVVGICAQHGCDHNRIVVPPPKPACCSAPRL